MKILAVIPARKGSKGIPNKNIRIVKNKPLIYYTIKNAMDSSFITDVIVTTDSAEISAIAKKMGVESRLRELALCGDDVTLDAVVYDAARDIECDYVVTMQPTSPTLKRRTLDAAINYCIDNDLDTLISVINKPHLAWIDNENGQKTPVYKQRLNRQYMSHYYIETGAFLISRKDIITNSSRIGPKIDVYQIGEDEAVDIDTFDDLLAVEKILSDVKIAIYVNGNNKRGIGHIYRSLEIADFFNTKPTIYYDIHQTDVRSFGFTTHKLEGVDGLSDLFNKLSSGNYNVVINDILTTTIDYMIALRRCLPGVKIINFEDDGEGIYNADLVINDLYNEETLPTVKAGYKYYIPSKLFMLYDPIQINESVKTIFTCFGGADPQNYTDRLLKIITTDKYKNYSFIFALGRAKENVDELMAFNKYPNIEVFFDVPNMPDLMSKSDLAITSRGRTGYEVAMLGIPTIVLAQNKREGKHTFINNVNGFFYLGINPSDETIEKTLDMFINMSSNERLQYQNQLLAYDIKSGGKRVKRLIDELIYN